MNIREKVAVELSWWKSNAEMGDCVKEAEKIDALYAEDRREMVETLRKFKETRGVHVGPHNEQTISVCAKCDEAYVRAEAELDAALAKEGGTP